MSATKLRSNFNSSRDGDDDEDGEYIRGKAVQGKGSNKTKRRSASFHVRPSGPTPSLSSPSFSPSSGTFPTRPSSLSMSLSNSRDVIVRLTSSSSSVSAFWSSSEENDVDDDDPLHEFYDDDAAARDADADPLQGTYTRSRKKNQKSKQKDLRDDDHRVVRLDRSSSSPSVAQVGSGTTCTTPKSKRTLFLESLRHPMRRKGSLDSLKGPSSTHSGSSRSLPFFSLSSRHLRKTTPDEVDHGATSLLEPYPSSCASKAATTSSTTAWYNEALPYELLLHIFGRLSMRELGVVCLVCRFWKEASEADCLWKSITLSLWGGLGLRDVQRASAARADHQQSGKSKKKANRRSFDSQNRTNQDSPHTGAVLSMPFDGSSSAPPRSSSPSTSKTSHPRPSGVSPPSHFLPPLVPSDSWPNASSSTSSSSDSSPASSSELSPVMPRKRSFFGLLSSGEGNSAEGRNNRTADSGSTDYLSSFSTLKDLYRHEFERRQKRGEDEYRIVVVGASGVDKSAICVRFVQGSLMTKYDPTAEESYRVRRKVDGLPCMYDIMDTAGQMEYSALRDQYLKSGHGFLLVYSVTSLVSFQALEKLRLQILRIKEDPTVPIVFLGSHADRESQRQVTQDEALFLAEKLNCGWMECSAKTGHNVNDAFELIVRMINRWRALHPNWNTPKSRQEATIKNKVKKKILFWREHGRG